MISGYNQVMDVPVGHLNHRLALQLPRELPLGLVFVVGIINGWQQTRLTHSTRQVDNVQYRFDLVDEPYRIHCHLLSHKLSELNLTDGDRVRVGGHLRFDAQQAAYYLLARDIERLDDTAAAPIEPEKNSDEAEIAALLANIRQRDKSAKLPQAELPAWVQQMAPNSIRSDTAVSESSKPQETETAVALPPEMVAYLSDAMDGEEEVEITSEVLAQFQPQTTATAPPAHPATAHPEDEAMRNEPVRLDPAKTAHYRQTPQDEIDWLVVLLITALLVVAAIAAVVLLSG